MIGADKTGAIFVMDRNNLGKFHAKSNKVVQQVQGAKPGYNTTAAYWQESVYYSGDTQRCRRYCVPTTPPTSRTNFITAARPETAIPRGWQISSRFRQLLTARSTSVLKSNSTYTDPFQGQLESSRGAINPELAPS